MKPRLPPLERYLTVAEARAALARYAAEGAASRCRVNHQAVLVFVWTPDGMGQFTRKEWEASA